MIKTLYIKNFILMDEIFLDFTDGFNVLLGETGAGKSIIIKAIDVALGAKVSKEVLKNQEKHALIEAVFENDGVETVISREISTTGTKCRINGALVNLESVKEEREKLIDIHTQFQTYAYIGQKFHIELLDLYIKAKNSNFVSLLTDYGKNYKRYLEITNLLEKNKSQADSNKERIEFLKFQINEIETAAVKENEEEELKGEIEVLSNVQELKELSYGTYWTLSGEDGSIIEVLGKLGYNVSKIKDFDKEAGEIEESFFGALESLRDVSNSLRSYSEALEDNPERLDEANERLETIQKLKRKYGDIFNSYEKFRLELKNLESENYTTEELEKEIEILKPVISNKAQELNSIRKDFALELSKIITAELKKLEFDRPVFEIQVDETDLNLKGKNRVEFMITTNAAKDLAPLVKVASGGEISRIMLALKTVFAHVDKISTVIFDEIDTGISGKTSISVANEIYELSKSIQVFAITHQPIIASKAKSVYWISKVQLANDTRVDVKKLGFDGKIQALAQMSSGEINEKSLNFARELVEKAGV